MSDVRYISQWDEESVDDADMVKIDLLALGALSPAAAGGATGAEPQRRRAEQATGTGFVLAPARPLPEPTLTPELTAALQRAPI